VRAVSLRRGVAAARGADGQLAWLQWGSTRANKALLKTAAWARSEEKSNRGEDRAVPGRSTAAPYVRWLRRGLRSLPGSRRSAGPAGGHEARRKRPSGPAAAGGGGGVEAQLTWLAAVPLGVGAAFAFLLSAGCLGAGVVNDRKQK